MARRKKSEDEILLTTPDEPETGKTTKTVKVAKSKPAPEKRVAKITEVTRRTYAEDLPEEEEEEDDPLPDPVLETLAQFRDSLNDTVIKIYRYNTKWTGSSSQHAPYEYVDTIPLAPDFDVQIKENFGGGKYGLQFMVAGKYAGRRIFAVAGPPLEFNPATQQGLLPYQKPDPMADLERSFAMLERFTTITQKLNPASTAIAALPMTPEQAAAQVMISQPELFKGAIRQMLASPKEQATSLFESLIAAGLDNIDKIYAIIRAMQSGAIPPPAPVSETPANDQQQTTQGTQSEADMFALLSNLAGEITSGASAERGAGWIIEFNKTHPEWKHIIDGMVTAEPEIVVRDFGNVPALAHASQHQNALPYVRQLQTLLKGAL